IRRNVGLITVDIASRQLNGLLASHPYHNTSYISPTIRYTLHNLPTLSHYSKLILLPPPALHSTQVHDGSVGI
ncbi:hypothetical protein J6590_099532, partial [Homalodisca vitripennis]